MSPVSGVQDATSPAMGFQEARLRGTGQWRGSARRAPGPRSKGEESALLRRYAETRDPALQEELVHCFLPLARSLALRYRAALEPVEDLIQVASLGLVKALEGFEPDRGKSFAAYAAPTILGELRRHFRDKVSQVRLPRRLQENAMAVRDAARKLSEELGRSPTVSQIAELLELSQEEVSEAMCADEARHTLSLDPPGAREDADALPIAETVGRIEPGYDRVEAQMCANETELDDRERQVLRLRFHNGLTQSEIGADLGLSQMQISRIMRGALAKLLADIQEGARPVASQPSAGR